MILVLPFEVTPLNLFGLAVFLFLDYIFINLKGKILEISKLASAAVTELNLLHPMTKQPTGVIVHGNTPDSREWKKLQKDVAGPTKKQSLILQKGQQKIELDGDGAEKQNEILIRSITAIKGFENAGKPVELEDDIAIKSLLDDPRYTWILEQWSDHVDDRSNFFVKSETIANSGASVSDS